MANVEAQNTVQPELLVAKIEVRKNVLSPNSEARIRRVDSRHTFSELFMMEEIVRVVL